ncbi:MAG: hypothetical protein E7541_06640 [Ruminococcaceae bacterium]|nr:hypothetical protein [Oscillospiraceae bacterium]
MIAPTLLVGLGGTGSKVVCRVSQMVTEEQRQRIGFAVFDTDINELREIREANPFIKTVQTSTKLSVGEYLNIDTHARDTWFPVNAILNSKTLTEGAGQVRAISRLALDTAIRAGNMEPLHAAIEDLYKLEEEQSDQALRVIIVSSLAGGTGSGLILPVAMYIKNFLATRFQQSANITRGFFILPEVFYEVIRGQAERNNLKCNAYATLRELDAFLMKGDATLPDKYADTVHLEFPRVGSGEFEEYNVRPYDFCFLFDAQNTEGKKLNSFNQYLDHAANCIYSQSIGPMNKRSNSSEDNTIRELCAEQGRNRYAGAGSSMLIYPMEDVKEYIALKWTQECVSSQWLKFDEMYKEIRQNNAEMRSRGYNVKDTDPAAAYIQAVEEKANGKDPFAMSIVNQCSRFDESGLTREGVNWEIYLQNLTQYITLTSSRDDKLDRQKLQAETMINEINGGSDVWTGFQDAYHEMDKYRALAVKHKEDAARNIAYTIFKAKNDSATTDKQPHQLETYLRDEEGQFIHPNAVRYFLYKVAEVIRDEKRKTDNRIEEEKIFFEGSKSWFDNAKTEETETVDDLSERKASLKNTLGGKLTEEQTELKHKFRSYLDKVDEFRADGILSEVLSEGLDYVNNLCEAFMSFYYSFESKIKGVDRKIATLYKKYNHTAGKTSRYVCASKECLDRFTKNMPYTGNIVSIDGELARTIYDKVRNYSMLKDKPDNTGYFSEIFEEGIIGYFKTKLMQTYGDEVNMDIITALEREAEYEHGICESKNIEQYVKRAIAETRKLSNPFIERPLGEQKAPISACTYNPKLDPKDDSPRSDLISKELRNFGGSPDEDIPLGMIMFYQSIYGLRANKLSKFAPADESGRGEGEYFKAYYELVSQIKPKSDKTPVITPHIDRHWHIISAIPDLDEKNQEAQEHRVYKAFLLGLLFDMITYSKISEGKFLYRLEIKGCKAEEFVVSNQTPCDNFYEVLDALTINPVVVNCILEAAERIFDKEINGSTKVTFATSKMMEQLSQLASKEFAKDNLTLFDIATLLKVSTPSANFDKNVGIDLMRVMLDVVYDYMKSLTIPSELDRQYGKFVVEQYKKFDANIDWYLSNWKDNYSSFIDDMIRAATESLEDKDLDDECDEIRKHRKAAVEKRG